MRHALAVILLFILGSAQAAPVTIDFEEFNVGDASGLFSPPLQSQGYNISGNVGPPAAEILIGTNTGTKSFGGAVSGMGGPGIGFTASIFFERTDGGAFAVQNLDLLLDTDPEGSTSITGTLAGGGTANLGMPVGSGDWLNLESLLFSGESNPNLGFGTVAIELDNVVVSAVPVPAAVWLFGSALAGLGWMRRKQTI